MEAENLKSLPRGFNYHSSYAFALSASFCLSFQCNTAKTKPITGRRGCRRPGWWSTALTDLLSMISTFHSAREARDAARAKKKSNETHGWLQGPRSVGRLAGKGRGWRPCARACLSSNRCWRIIAPPGVKMAHSHVDEAWLPFWEEWGLGTSVVSFFFRDFLFHSEGEVLEYRKDVGGVIHGRTDEWCRLAYSGWVPFSVSSICRSSCRDVE